MLVSTTKARMVLKKGKENDKSLELPEELSMKFNLAIKCILS